MNNSAIDKTAALPGLMVLPPMHTSSSYPPQNTNVKSNKSSQRTVVTTNRFDEINTFVDYTMAQLPRAEAYVWWVLWRDTKPCGTAKTSMNDIARRIGSTRRSVVTAIAKLEKRGLLTVVYRGGLDKGNNVYRVHPMIKTLE